MSVEGVHVRREAMAAGWTAATIVGRVRAGHWERRYDGIYVEAGDGPDESQKWRRELGAHLARAGEGALASHRSAARLHSLDGDWGDAIDVLVPHRGATLHIRPAVRSRTLEPHDATVVEGIPVSSLGRTLADLGRFVSLDALEIAVESALRIDPREPHVWRHDLLAELYDRIRPRPGRRPGHAELRVVLSRRPPGARPTGSAAETKAIQALRKVGLGGLSRQPTVRLHDRRGRVVQVFYPDLADLERGFLVEIDGFEAHGTPDAMDADLRRQNALMQFFHVERATGRRVHRDPGEFASLTLTAYERQAMRGERWTAHGHLVTVSAEGCDIHPDREARGFHYGRSAK